MVFEKLSGGIFGSSRLKRDEIYPGGILGNAFGGFTILDRGITEDDWFSGPNGFLCITFAKA